jgi:hypothetical protein
MNSHLLLLSEDLDLNEVPALSEKLRHVRVVGVEVEVRNVDRVQKQVVLIAINATIVAIVAIVAIVTIFAVNCGECSGGRLVGGGGAGHSEERAKT